MAFQAGIFLSRKRDGRKNKYHDDGKDAQNHALAKTILGSNDWTFP